MPPLAAGKPPCAFDRVGDAMPAAFPFRMQRFGQRQSPLLITRSSWQAVGRDVSELSAAFYYAIQMGARLEDVAGIIHAHPTLGEAVQESALRSL